MCCCDPAVGAGAPVPTIQNVAAAGPTAITDTMYTHVRVDMATIGAAASVVLPAPAAGKRVTVFNWTADTSTLTVTPNGGETIYGVVVIAAGFGSLEFISDGTNWDSI